MLYKDKNGKETVFGIFGERRNIEQAINELTEKGFDRAAISVLMPVPTQVAKYTRKIDNEQDLNTIEEICGGVVGSLLGAGAILATGGLGIFVAGPVLTALGGTTVLISVRAMIGYLISRTLSDYGVPDEELYQYCNVIKEGGHLLLVHIENSSQASTALEILKNNRAKDVTVQKDNIDKSQWEKEIDESGHVLPFVKKITPNISSP